MSPTSRTKKYIQKYRASWEFMKDFRGWLKPLPRDKQKAYCSFCHVIIKAHLCDLRKHGAAKKHKNAARLVKLLKRIREGQSEDVDSDQNFLRDNQDIQEELSDYEENLSEEEVSNRWTDAAMESLIKHTKLHWKDLQDGLRKKKDIWRDISYAMAQDGHFFSGLECDKKFRNMKERYFNILERSSMDNVNYRVEYFDDLREMLANNPRTISINEQKDMLRQEILKAEVIIDGEFSEEDTEIMEESCMDNLADSDSIWTETAVNLMLEFLPEFKDFFTGNEGENEDEVWQNVKEQMHMEGIEVSESQCRKKWHSLVKKYNECKLMMETTGVSPTWPHFKRVKHILQTVKIPTQNDRRYYGIKAKRGRKRGRKRKTFEETTGAEDSDVSEGESSSHFKRFDSFGDEDNNSSSNNNHKGKETLSVLRKLANTASLWRRMDAIETRLDDLSDYHEIQRQTNSLLSQILNEISVLSGHLSPVTGEQVSVQDGITIVVPNSEHSIH